jgi:hypothetical protein
MVISIMLVPMFGSPALAATKATTLSQAFQKYITDGDLAYTNAVSSAKTLYMPQIAAAQAKIAAALAQFRNVNQAIVLAPPPPSNTGLRNYISVLKCPLNSDCSTPGTLTGGYSVGAVTSIMDFAGGDQAFSSNSLAQMNLGLLQTVDLGVSNGLFKLSNPTEYNSVANSLRNQYESEVSLSDQYSNALSAAASDKDYVHSMQPAINAAILSSKRAAANGSSFDKAFLVSFQFEYNAKRLNELARQPWTYISSLKELQDAVSVTKQSNLADAISSRYSYAAASKFNVAYGNLFLSEPVYKSWFKVVSSIYKSATGISLSNK